jgi:hypothetical protein
MDKEIGPAIKRKKYVVIKINNVATNNQLAATHVHGLRGILDYLALAFRNTRSANCSMPHNSGSGSSTCRRSTHSWGEARYREARIQIT